MSRTHPTELAFDETLTQPDRVLAPYVTDRKAEAYASYTVTLHTSGQRWLRHELGQFTWSIPTNDWTGAAGTTCSADEALPSWLRDEVEAYRPTTHRIAELVDGPL